MYSFGIGNFKQVKKIIRRGEDVNAKNNENETALMFAADNGK